MPDHVTLMLYIFSRIFILILVLGIIKSSKRNNNKRKVESIELGMSEEEMLSIMGNKYTRSLLKNNRTKYEFRFNNSSSYSYNGYRTYYGVKKVDIYCKDGLVEEVRPYNV